MLLTADGTFRVQPNYTGTIVVIVGGTLSTSDIDLIFLDELDNEVKLADLALGENVVQTGVGATVYIKVATFAGTDVTAAIFSL